MLDCLIFSKDRACQLDALLKSITDNFTELQNIFIVFKSSNEDFAKGYEIVKNRFSQFKWIEEQNFVNDVKKIVFTFNNPFALTLVDDEIVVRNYELKKSLSLLSQTKDIHCLSLRMGTNVNYTYTANVVSPPPNFSIYKHEETTLFKWDWEICNPISDWGYPSCINSHIYRKDFFKFIFFSIPFKSVNYLESNLNMKRNMFKQYMICFEKSKTVSIANNLTQSGTNRHSNKEEFSLESLNKKILAGYRIDVNKLYNLNINMATFEKDYDFIKE